MITKNSMCFSIMYNVRHTSCVYIFRRKGSRRSVYKEPERYHDYDKASLYTSNNTPRQPILYDTASRYNTGPRMLMYRDPSPSPYYGQHGMQQLPEITYDNRGFEGEFD